MKNKILNQCRICFSKKLVKYLDLGKQPFSNSFLNYKGIKNEKKFSFSCRSYAKIVVLANYQLYQILQFIFSKYDYLSSASKALSNHYKKLVEETCQELSTFLLEHSVLDIGCNDGILLNHYPKKLQ